MHGRTRVNVPHLEKKLKSKYKMQPIFKNTITLIMPIHRVRQKRTGSRYSSMSII